jgi:hypothetical protein
MALGEGIQKYPRHFQLFAIEKLRETGIELGRGLALVSGPISRPISRGKILNVR